MWAIPHFIMKQTLQVKLKGQRSVQAGIFIWKDPHYEPPTRTYNQQRNQHIDNFETEKSPSAAAAAAAVAALFNINFYM